MKNAKRKNAAKLGQNIVVLKEQNIAYVRIPKVANTSIKFVLAHRMMGLPDDEQIRGTTKDRYWRDHEKGDLVDVTELRESYPGIFCFSFVRNPYDRLLACYNNKIVENEELSSAMQAMGLAHKMPFADFVEIVANTPDRKADVHLRSQAGMLLDDERKVFPDFIGHLENIGQDWARLGEAMTARGLQPFGALPTMNVRRTGNKARPEEFYTDELRKKVFARYRKDFRFFYPKKKS